MKTAEMYFDINVRNCKMQIGTQHNNEQVDSYVNSDHKWQAVYFDMLLQDRLNYECVLY